MSSRLSFAAPSSSSSSSSSSTARQVWQVIYWCYMHQSYFRVGLVFWEYIGEYCLKLALSRMDPSEASRKKKMFLSLGIDVDKVRNDTIYRVIQTLWPSHLCEHEGNSPSSFYNYTDSVLKQLYATEQNVQHIISKEISRPIHTVEEALHHILSKIMSLPHFFHRDTAAQDEAAHVVFAEYLLSLKGDWKKKEEIIQKSIALYGGSHWFEVGLSAVETKFEERKTLFANHCQGISSAEPSKQEAVQWLRNEYEHWSHWSLSFVDVVKKAEPIFQHQIKTARAFIYGNNQTT